MSSQRKRLIMLLGILYALHGWGMDMQSEEAKTLADFNNMDEQSQWRVVNDGVMGGLSTSQMKMTEQKTAIFAGEVSLENNGGFASVRRAPHDYELAGFDGVMLRVKGDGRTYQLRVRTNDRFDGVAYRKEFKTKPDEWLEVKISFSAMEPTFRGRKVPDAPPLKAENIRQSGFLIGDKKAGPFRLEIDWIKAYREENGEQ